MRVALFVATLLVSAVSLDAAGHLSMTVSPIQSFAPTHLTIRFHLEPDDSNRALEVTAQSSGYYRSSRIELEGAQAPRTISFEFSNVPGGSYDVVGTLITNGGKPRTAVRQQVTVIGVPAR